MNIVFYVSNLLQKAGIDVGHGPADRMAHIFFFTFVSDVNYGQLTNESAQFL